MQNDEPPFLVIVATTVVAGVWLTWYSVRSFARRRRRDLKGKLWATILERMQR